MHRAAAPPPPSVVPEDSFCLAFAMEDLTQLLVRAAEPLRVKSNGWSLFAAAERELERGLLPLPAWLTQPQLFPENTPGARVREALRLARELAFVDESGTPGRDLGLVTTSTGWAWLDQSPHDRLALLLDIQRPRPETARGRSKAEEAGEDGATPFDDDEDALELELLDEELAAALDGEFVPFAGARSRRSNALSDETLFGHSVGSGMARAAIEAYTTLEPGRAVLVSDFLRHHAQNSNPFLELAEPRRQGFAGYWSPPTEEMLEELWMQGLQRIFHLYLLPYGGVSVGLASAGGLTIELTGIGRYLLRLAPEFTFDAPAPGKTPVRVQPDFEVVFVSASPSIEAALSRFAERRGSGVGVLFRITRDSILAAAQAGLDADEVLATLARSSTTPVPANVEHEIRAWFGRCRRLSLEPAYLVRCPDAATAARVLSAAGAGKLELISETVLALTDPAHKAAVTKACRKAGLFLVSGGAEDSPPRRKRRRYSHWR
ncbi:MAG: hypothetical protein HOP15_16500 [Planctomycetes bacterium]|nr:hypothetical protein [Planctomycetota bacterium]